MLSLFTNPNFSPMKRQEDYLRAVYELKKKHGHVRVSDVAKNLGIQRASVTQMIQRLYEEGYVIHKPYSPVELTEKGEKIAFEVSRRYYALKDFFDILGVSAKVQEKDRHEIEHCLSAESLEKLCEVTKFLKKKRFTSAESAPQTKKAPGFLGIFTKKK